MSLDTAAEQDMEAEQEDNGSDSDHMEADDQKHHGRDKDDSPYLSPGSSTEDSDSGMF